jgi:hypothetical protein
MPPLPPLKYVLDALHQNVLPGAGGAALVMAVFLLFGRRAAALGSALAVVAAFVWANYEPKLPEGESTPTWTNSARLSDWKPAENAPCSHWLPRAALVLVLVGLTARWVGLIASRVLSERAWWGANLLVWLPRVGVVYVVSGWLVRGVAASKPEWEGLRWVLATTMIALWLVTDSFARDGFSTEVSAYLGACLFAAAAVLIYTHNKLFMDLAVVVGSAMFGIAAVSALVKPGPDGRNGEPGAKVLATGAIPAAIAFLPGLILGTRPSHNDHLVPVICFWLVALAPLVLAPFLVPRISRQNRWLLLALRVLLVLAPLVVAVVLAAKYEDISYGDGAEEWSRAPASAPFFLQRDN